MRGKGSAEAQRGGFSNVCKKTYDLLPAALLRYLGCSAEYACGRHVRRHSRNRGTNSNSGDGNASRKHSNAGGNTRDASGQFGDSNHAAANDHRSGLNFADTNPGQYHTAVAD
jgi:hypothetical protein